ncbi:hypothetical protein B2J69_17285 [Pantoea latae]|uniref:Uncharacterized protein n=1 Tax=Pantoea latae TaxID=1964541 RepID=A0A1V9DDC1_9GAMM|nr:hypothetical protein B2J69_17285 [Pantoea latae]
MTPLSTGVVSRVLAPSAKSTGALPLSSETVSVTVAGGCVAATVRSNGAVAALTLPAASVTVRVRLCGPSARTGEVKLQLPSVPTLAVPSSVSPS